MSHTSFKKNKDMQSINVTSRVLLMSLIPRCGPGFFKLAHLIPPRGTGMQEFVRSFAVPEKRTREKPKRFADI